MELSPFSRLSAELRNEIYELTVILPESIAPAQPGNSNGTNKSVNLPGILHCCRQIREECLQMFYASNTFNFRCNAWRSQADENNCVDWIHGWLDEIGTKNCSVLRAIHIDLGRHTERLNRRSLLPIENRHAVWQIHQLAPRIACLASRFPLSALSISSSWLVESRIPNTCRFERRSLVEAKRLHLFRVHRDRFLPHIDTERVGLRNSTIDDFSSAILVGGGRQMLTFLIHAIWSHCCYLQDDFDRGRRSLQVAFESIDPEQAKVATALLADEHRGYPIIQVEPSRIEAALRIWVVEVGR